MIKQLKDIMREKKKVRHAKHLMGVTDESTLAASITAFIIKLFTDATVVNVLTNIEDMDIILEKHLKKKGFVHGWVTIDGHRHMGYNRGFISVVITDNSVLIGHCYNGSVMNVTSIDNPLYTIDKWITYMDRL